LGKFAQDMADFKLEVTDSGSYYKMNEDGTHTDRIVRAQPIVTYDMMLRSNFIGCSTAIYDTAVCGNVLMPSIQKRQDYGLWLRILRKGYVAIGVYEPLVHYRIRSHSVSSNKIIAAFYHWKVLRICTDISLFYSFFLFVQYAWIGLRKHKV